jgi:hypothetical protein
MEPLVENIQIEEDIDNLSETDRILLKQVADSNKAVLIQMKRNELSFMKVIDGTYGKIRELLSFMVVIGGMMWAFTSLPPDLKNKAASQIIDVGVPVLVTVAGTGTMIKGSRDSKDRSNRAEIDATELKELEDSFNKG